MAKASATEPDVQLMREAIAEAERAIQRLVKRPSTPVKGVLNDEGKKLLARSVC